MRQVYDAYRLLFALIVVAALSLAAAVTYYRAADAKLYQQRLEANGLSRRGGAATASAVRAVPSKVDLKTFRSSHLMTILEQGASSANVKLDEISFAVDDAPQQAFVRYRASFQLVSRYPAIRKFISEILAGSEGVVLDTVACRREDINVADVRCDISAYVAYQEKAGG